MKKSDPSVKQRFHPDLKYKKITICRVLSETLTNGDGVSFTHCKWMFCSKTLFFWGLRHPLLALRRYRWSLKTTRCGILGVVFPHLLTMFPLIGYLLVIVHVVPYELSFFLPEMISFSYLSIISLCFF